MAQRHMYYKLARDTKTKALNISTSLILMAMSLGGALPVFLSQKAFANGVQHTVCASSCAYPSIQAAIDDSATQPGDTIDIQAGNYNLTSTVNVTKKLTIVAEPDVHFNSDGLGSAFAVPAAGAGTTFQNLSFNAATGVTNNGFISVNANDVTITGSTFDAHYVPGVTQTTRGIVVSPGAQNLTVTGNYFNTIRQPAYIDNGVTGTISNNYAEGTKGWVVGADSNLNFSGNSWGTSTVIGSGNLKNAVDIAIITNASSSDSYQDILSLSHANNGAVIDNQYEHTSTDAYVDATGAFVDTTPGATSNGYWTSPYRTIQSGVNAVVAGGTVHVAAGSYTEDVTVAKAMTINGAQAQKDARGSRTGAESVLNGNFTLNASYVTVDGFTVNGTANSAAFKMLNGNAIRTHIIYNTIINVGAGSAAISYDSSHDTFSHNLITMSSTAYSGIQANSNPGSFTQIVGNKFVGSAPNADADINFIGAASYAQPSTTPSNILVDQNESDGQSGTFVAAFFTKGLSVTNNNVENDPNSVIYLGGGNNGVTVTGNTIANSATAVNVAQYADPSSHPTWPSWPANSSVSAHNNSFVNDTKGVKVSTGAITDATVDATNNWWGAASGPEDLVGNDGSILDMNTNGTGSAAIGAVKYTSWCTVADCSQLSDTAMAAPTNLTPADGTYTNNPAFSNTWTPVTGAAKYEYTTTYTLNGSTQTYTDYSTASNYDVTPTLITRHNNGSPEATYTWKVRAYNAEGTAGPWSTPQDVTVDKTAPNVPTLTTPQNNTYLNTNDFNFIWSSSSDGGSPVKYEFQSSLNGHTTSGVLDTGVWNNIANGNAEQNNLVTPQIHSTGAPDGIWYWQVRAIDAAGNKSAWSKVWNVTLDTKAPVATITAPHDGDAVRGTVTVSGTVTDTNPDHYYFVVKDSNGVVKAGPGTVNQVTVTDWNWNTKNVSDGVYTLDLEARDAAGNKGPASVATIQVTVDNTAPTVTINGSTGTNTTPTLTGTVDDSSATLTVTIDGGTAAAATNRSDGTWSFTIPTALGVGTHTVVVTATDAVGNTNSTSATVTVQAPKASVVALNNSQGNGRSDQAPGHQPTVTVTPTNGGQVLGVTTDTPNSVSNKGQGKGDSINLTANDNQKPFDSTKSSNFLGLGWWWLVIVAIAGLFWFLLAAKSRSNDKA